VRVDTGLPTETRRYIFPAPTPAIAALAATIEVPGILIKLCAALPDLLALLPPGWRGHPQSFFMACDGPMRSADRPLPDDYTLTLTADGPVVDARDTTADGILAARGRAVTHAGLYVYDRIRTEADHQRRGLGGHVMRALATRQAAGDRAVLTATAAGHALYTHLGWTTLSLYSTAEREPGDA
jgi:GNAT superfamily N-acetyltransferase